VTRRLGIALAVVAVLAVVLVVARPFGGSAPKVETAAVTKGALESTIELAGTVAARDTRTLGFATAGRVAEVKVAAGDEVAAGAVLATLDGTVADAQLAAATAAVDSASATKTSADASLTAAKSRYDADRKAGQPAAVLDADRAQIRAAEAQVAAAKTQLASAEAQVAAAQQSVDNLALTSPIAGTVVSVGLEVGDLAGAGGGLGGAGTIVVADLATLQVSTTASEIDVVSLKADMPVALTFDALPDLALEGTICELGSVGTGTGGVVEFPVTVCLASQDAALRVGMSANVSIVLARAEGALIVPAQAIRTVDGAPTVRVLGADGKITTVAVEVGISSGTRTQLLSGVAEGDLVVLGDTGSGG
jgi:macrolide-specific efflux system membrane fusion protein